MLFAVHADNCCVINCLAVNKDTFQFGRWNLEALIFDELLDSVGNIKIAVFETLLANLSSGLSAQQRLGSQRTRSRQVPQACRRTLPTSSHTKDLHQDWNQLRIDRTKPYSHSYPRNSHIVARGPGTTPAIPNFIRTVTGPSSNTSTASASRTSTCHANSSRHHVGSPA
jgi:hypothetical protein